MQLPALVAYALTQRSQPSFHEYEARSISRTCTMATVIGDYAREEDKKQEFCSMCATVGGLKATVAS